MVLPFRLAFHHLLFLTSAKKEKKKKTKGRKKKEELPPIDCPQILSTELEKQKRTRYIHVAAKYGHADVIKEILENGVFCKNCNLEFSFCSLFQELMHWFQCVVQRQ